jgi:hypothetical protein
MDSARTSTWTWNDQTIVARYGPHRLETSGDLERLLSYRWTTARFAPFANWQLLVTLRPIDERQMNLPLA